MNQNTRGWGHLPRLVLADQRLCTPHAFGKLSLVFTDEHTSPVNDI